MPIELNLSFRVAAFEDGKKARLLQLLAFRFRQLRGHQRGQEE
jgi:hypothetical protein